MPTFTPPTVKQRMSMTHPLFSRYSIDVGQSVVKRDGVFQLTPFPWLGEIAELEEGVEYFMGGRTYAVSDEIAAELDVAGFGYDYIGYGEGGFGGGSYGG